MADLRPEVPAGLAEIVAKMMEKKPERRYQTPQEVATALAQFLAAPQAELPTVRTQAPADPVPVPGRRRYWPVWAAGLLVFGFGGLTTFLGLQPWLGNDGPAPLPPPSPRKPRPLSRNGPAR